MRQPSSRDPRSRPTTRNAYSPDPRSTQARSAPTLTASASARSTTEYPAQQNAQATRNVSSPLPQTSKPPALSTRARSPLRSRASPRPLPQQHDTSRVCPSSPAPTGTAEPYQAEAPPTRNFS